MTEEKDGTKQQQLLAAIDAILSVQLAELWRALQAQHVEWGLLGIPNAMQLVYRDSGITFAWGGDVELFLKADGEDKALSGESLVESLTGNVRLSLPDRAPFSHFTLIQGGGVAIDGVAVPRKMRPLLAWDLHNVLSYVAASPEELPYPHKLAQTFREFHVRMIVEVLGVRRGPIGRQDRLHRTLRTVRSQAGDDDYIDEVTSATSSETAGAGFWKGVSAVVPPWRFLKVHGQAAEFTRHEGRDTVPGHLAERVLTDMLHRYEMVIQRRVGTERVLLESELDAGLDSPPDVDVELAALSNVRHAKMMDDLKVLPGFDAWYMHEALNMRQKDIAAALNISQSRVSQLKTAFEEQHLLAARKLLREKHGIIPPQD